jgi:hypothetical protein
MLQFNYFYEECLYAECSYADCHSTILIMHELLTTNSGVTEKNTSDNHFLQFFVQMVKM